MRKGDIGDGLIFSGAFILMYGKHTGQLSYIVGGGIGVAIGIVLLVICIKDE